MNTELKVEQWDINKLIDYARNPRKNDEQIPKMVAAIKEFGFRIPVVAKSDGTVIDGHLRLKAARQMGLQTVPVALADELTDTQVKAFRLLANQSANWAEWDNDLLKLELDDLKLADFDINLIGFDEDFLSSLSPVKTDEGLTDPDDVPDVEEQQEPVSKLGDIWLCGDHRVMCGDSTNEKDVTQLLSNCKMNICLTDPPYGLGNTKSKKNNYIEYEDTKDNLKTLISNFLPLAQKYCDVIVLTPGIFNQSMYPTPTWIMAWFTPAGVGRGPWGFCCWQPILCYGKDPKLAHRKGSYPDAIVHTEASEDFGHPCTKPIKFWQWLMERTTEKKDRIYDPFCGSGTTIVAAEMLGRIAYGMELSPQYVDVIIKRWQDYTGKNAILESTGKTFNELANVQTSSGN